MATKTINVVSRTPMRATYRDFEGSMNLTLDVASSIQPVNRDKLRYNHVKKTVTVRDIIKVPGSCNTSCVTTPVLLEIRFSAPAGVDGQVYDNLLKAALTAHSGATSPVIKPVDAITFDDPTV